MKKIYQYITLVLCLLTQFLFSQFENNAIKNKNILIVYGGWLDHQPEIFAGKIANWLETQQANVTLSKSTGIYLDKTVMSKTDLIIQHITMSTIKSSESKALQNAVANGTALAGCHGGLGDSFRNDTDFQYMIGGQFVKHPGGQVDYSVKISKPGHFVTKGIEGFSLNSEQYYMHIDPSINIIATTVFSGDHDPWIEGVEMPVVWTKTYGKGKIFYSSLGHSADIFEIPEVWKIMTRGVTWAVSKNMN
jgi:type 1 glutamine amidotransferase